MFRINDRVEIVFAETIQRLGRLSVPAIGDALGRFDYILSAGGSAGSASCGAGA